MVKYYSNILLFYNTHHLVPVVLTVYYAINSCTTPLLAFDIPSKDGHMVPLFALGFNLYTPFVYVTGITNLFPMLLPALCFTI